MVVISGVVVTSGALVEVSGGGTVLSEVSEEDSEGGSELSGAEDDSEGGVEDSGAEEVLGGGVGLGGEGIEGGAGGTDGVVEGVSSVAEVGSGVFSVVVTAVVSVTEREVDCDAGSESRKTKTSCEVSSGSLVSVAAGSGEAVGAADVTEVTGGFVVGWVGLTAEEVLGGSAETAGGAGGVVLIVSAGVTIVTEASVSSVFSESKVSASLVSDSVVSAAETSVSDWEESDSDSFGEVSASVSDSDADSVSVGVDSLLGDSEAVVVTSTSLVEEQAAKLRSIAGIKSEAIIFFVLFFIAKYPFHKLWGNINL